MRENERINRKTSRSTSMIPLYDPETDPLHQRVRAHPRLYRRFNVALWSLTVVFGIGDVVTTWLGVTELFGPPPDRLAESVALTRWVLATFGPLALLPKKALMLGAVWLISRLFPRPYNLGIVATAGGANAYLTWHNYHLLLTFGAITGI